MEARKGRRVILFPLPFQGHISPMLELAEILYFRGFSITIVHTTLNSPNPTNHPHFTFRSIANIPLPEAETSDALPVLDLILLLNERCREAFRECLAQLVSDAAEEPVACLISDAVLHFTRAVADEVKVPRLVLRTGGASSFVLFAAFPLLKDLGYLPIQESRLEEPVTEFPPLRVKDLPMIMDTCQLGAFYDLVCSMVKETKASSGVIWNTFVDLEEPALSKFGQDFTCPLFPIGPFHKLLSSQTSPSTSTSLLTQDQTSISWLQNQAPKSVVYASFGSLAAIDETDFLEIAWGLANSNQPFLWVVRPGLVRGSDWLPDGFMEAINGRGHIVKWAPQKEVLAHEAVGAFWSHCGWNSTLESLSEGVPMICMPCFSDQMVNARFVTEVWGAGVQLEKGSRREEIEKTIKRVMVEREGEAMRERAMKLKEKANEKGGSSCRSLNNLIDHILSLDSFTFKSQSLSG